MAKIVRHEESLGRADLILPIYLVTTPVLERPALLRADELASKIQSRQRYDWSDRADLPLTDLQVKRGVREVSEKIAAAITRTDPSFVRGSSSERDSEFRRISEIVEREQTGQRGDNIVPKSVLWVDDRPDNNISERRAMEAYNLSFDLAKSTGEALAKLGKKRYDLIISDMSRPPDARAGYTLLQTLRAG